MRSIYILSVFVFFIYAYMNNCSYVLMILYSNYAPNVNKQLFDFLKYLMQVFGGKKISCRTTLAPASDGSATYGFIYNDAIYIILFIF